MAKRYRHSQYCVTASGHASGFKFFMSAKNPLPLEFFSGSGATAKLTMAYDKIDDLMLCCDMIPINPDVYRMSQLAAFLPSAVIKEVMPEMSMNAIGLTKNNALYYRYDGKNDNGKLAYNLIPMGGGGYGSIASTTVNSGLKAAWLSNYGGEPNNLLTSARGFKFQDNNFNTYANSFCSVIVDLNLPNSVLTQQVISNNETSYFDYIKSKYNLEWYEQMLQTSFSRIKDAKQRQLVLDNLLICAAVTSQVSYNSGYRTYNFPPLFYSVSPLSNNVRGWTRSNATSLQFNDFEFYGNNIPAYFHFKFSTYPQIDANLTLALKSGDVFFDDVGYHIEAIGSVSSADVNIPKYMCNFNTGWTSANDNVNPNMNAEYIYRAAYSKEQQIITGDIDFKNTIECVDSYNSKSMVNLAMAKKEIANIDILNLEYPGVIL